MPTPIKLLHAISAAHKKILPPSCSIKLDPVDSQTSDTVWNYVVTRKLRQAVT
jgi:hypothetical protein